MTVSVCAEASTRAAEMRRARSRSDRAGRRWSLECGAEREGRVDGGGIWRVRFEGEREERGRMKLVRRAVGDLVV